MDGGGGDRISTKPGSCLRGVGEGGDGMKRISTCVSTEGASCAGKGAGGEEGQVRQKRMGGRGGR